MKHKYRHCEKAKPTKQSTFRVWIASLTLAMTLATTACGFEPVYGVNRNTHTGVEEKLQQISIGNIPNREGQFLKNELITHFYRDGRPTNPRYALHVDPISESLSDLDITKDSDATRGQLRLSTSIQLSDGKTGKAVLERSMVAIASYNILASEFTNRVSEQNARENALTDLARQIEQYVALYLKKTQ